MNIFSQYNRASSLTEKDKHGILWTSYNKKGSLILGPALNKNSSKKEVAEKIRQFHAYFYLSGVFPNNYNEEIPLFPKYEKEIIKYSFPSYVYSYYFMNKRWKEAEEIISKDKTSSLLYAINVLKKRFELGENSMKSDPEICLAYCIKIMKRKKLPQVMHQAMILNSINKEYSRFVSRYLNYKGVKG